ncbi:hypothetical protein J6590_107785 [Homalodisca vitripennis]|nr:hypothetical protein J6590_107785 [Homalodisca vitripennis]
MDWPSENRGSHVLVGVATKGGLLYPMKRKANGDDSRYRSWGWDLVTTKLFVDGVVHNGEGDRCYPLQQTEERYTVPDKFYNKLLIILIIYLFGYPYSSLYGE